MRGMSTRDAALTLLLLAACSPNARDEPVVTDTASAAIPAPAPMPAPPQSPPDTAWVVSLDRAGRFIPGMTLADGRTSIPDLEAPAKPAEGCDFATVKGDEPRLLFLIVDGRLARIDVRSATVPTDRGIRVGDTEAKVESAYAGHVTVQPHEYTDGHYLVVDNPRDTTIALIFETDGSKVTRYRLGTKPVVGWVEGCS
jgi:hypothetical protein